MNKLGDPQLQIPAFVKQTEAKEPLMTMLRVILLTSFHKNLKRGKIKQKTTL